MNTIVDFIRNFNPSNFDLGWLDLIIIVGLTIAGLVLTNWIASRLPVRTGNLVRGTVNVTLKVFCYGFIALVILHFMLTGDYGSILILATVIVGLKIDYFYKVYDNFVERRINRK